VYTHVHWYHFEASRVWKGPRQKRFQLFCSDSCDVEFPLHVGSTYLVYALHEPEEGYQFIGAKCDRILESPAAAAADLAMLGPGDTKLAGPDSAIFWWLAAALLFLGALAFINIRFRRRARR